MAPVVIVGFVLTVVAYLVRDNSVTALGIAFAAGAVFMYALLITAFRDSGRS